MGSQSVCHAVDEEEALDPELWPLVISSVGDNGEVGGEEEGVVPDYGTLSSLTVSSPRVSSLALLDIQNTVHPLRNKIFKWVKRIGKNPMIIGSLGGSGLDLWSAYRQFRKKSKWGAFIGSGFWFCASGLELATESSAYYPLAAAGSIADFIVDYLYKEGRAALVGDALWISACLFGMVAHQKEWKSEQLVFSLIALAACAFDIFGYIEGDADPVSIAAGCFWTGGAILEGIMGVYIAYSCFGCMGKPKPVSPQPDA